MKNKYQIFISSTYEDLKDEREQVIRAILEMGHFPVGMEMFSAGDDKQWKLITRQINASDYYVVIVAHRYGSMDGLISYTEKEYTYALRRGIPILGFVISDTAKWPIEKREKEQNKIDALEKFKVKVKLKSWKPWETLNDLYARVPIALINQMENTPRIGWIRPLNQKGAISPSSPDHSLGRMNKKNEQQKSPIVKISVRLVDLLDRVDKSIEEKDTSVAREYCGEYAGLLTKAQSLSQDSEILSLSESIDIFWAHSYINELQALKILRNYIYRFNQILSTL